MLSRSVFSGGNHLFGITFPGTLTLRRFAHRNRINLGQIPTVDLTTTAPITRKNVTVSPPKLPTIDWNTLPECRQLRWDELPTETRKKMGLMLFILACASVPPTGYLFYLSSLGGKVSTLAISSYLGTTITGLSSIVFSRMGPHPLDAKYRREQRMLLEKRIENVAYPELKISIEKYLFTEKELQILLSKDINALNYPQFVEKHSESVLSTLDKQNKKEITTKYLEWIAKQNEGVVAALNSKTTSILEVSPEKIISAVIVRETKFLGENTYADFVKRNGLETVKYIVENCSETTVNVLKSKFRTKVLDTMQNLGDISLAKQYEKDFEIFGPEYSQDVLFETTKKAVEFQLECEKTKYSHIRTFNSAEDFEKFLGIMTPVQSNKLRNAYLQLPYSLMLKWEWDQEKLGIYISDIKEALMIRWGKKSLQHTIKQEGDDIFLSIKNRVFDRSQIYEIIFEKGKELSIREIINLDNRIPLHVSTGDILPSKEIFYKALIKEVLVACPTFEDLEKKYPKQLFSGLMGFEAGIARTRCEDKLATRRATFEQECKKLKDQCDGELSSLQNKFSNDISSIKSKNKISDLKEKISNYRNQRNELESQRPKYISNRYEPNQGITMVGLKVLEEFAFSLNLAEINRKLKNATGKLSIAKDRYQNEKAKLTRELAGLENDVKQRYAKSLEEVKQSYKLDQETYYEEFRKVLTKESQ